MERQVEVCAFVEANDPCRNHQISDAINISRTTGIKCLEIFPRDQDARLYLRETIREKCDRDENFVRNIVFTDETSFLLRSRHNSSTARYWSRQNKHLNVVGKTQYSQKLNVWAGILGDRVIGPFFINETLNDQTFLQQQ